jgi:flagellar hook protein FlgE
MGSALNALVSTLNASKEIAKTQGANISQSVANGTKQVETVFSSVVSGGSQVSGVKFTTRTQVSQSGDIDQSGSMPDTFFAVTGGSGLVPVKFSDDGEILWTHLTDFSLDKNGEFVNSAGGKLQIMMLDNNGQLPAGGIDITRLTTAKISNISGQATPTSEIDLSFKLPAGKAANYSRTNSTTIYDSLGLQHTVNYQWTQNNAAGTQWQLTVTDDATPANQIYQNNITFDANGAISQIAGVGVAGTAANIALTFDFSAGGAANNQAITFKLGTFGDNTSGLTRGGNDPGAPKFTVNGSKPGDFSGVSIDKSGLIAANFVGSNQIRPIMQIVLGDFAAPNSMDPVSGTAYRQTFDSGPARISSPKDGIGVITSKALIKSTADTTGAILTLIGNSMLTGFTTRAISEINNAEKSLLSI